MKYHQLNAEQQDHALDQIVELENEWRSESERFTREDIEFDIEDGQNPDNYYEFEVITDNSVEVSKKG